MEQTEIYSLREIERIVLSKKDTCRFCKGKLGDAESYDHSGGIEVKGYVEKQWVYFTCLKCGQQWSLTHLLAQIRREE